MSHFELKTESNQLWRTPSNRWPSRELSLSSHGRCSSTNQALDPELVGEALGVMRSLGEFESATVVITHEMRFTQGLADELIMVDAGRIIVCCARPSTGRASKFFASLATR
jgi:hypothetical protein